VLHILPTQGGGKIVEVDRGANDVLWLDLLNPTSAEVKNVEESIGATLPTLGR
jgi:Mg2+ and Co2+ transporter CorA